MRRIKATSGVVEDYRVTESPLLELATLRRPPQRRLGDILVERGYVSEHDLLEVLEDQRHWDDNDQPGAVRLRLGALVVQHGLAGEEQVASALAELLGREVVDASDLSLDLPGLDSSRVTSPSAARCSS